MTSPLLTPVAVCANPYCRLRRDRWDASDPLYRADGDTCPRHLREFIDDDQAHVRLEDQ